MIEFFEKIVDLFLLPLEFLNNAAAALNNFHFDETILYDYLGYMHFAMGTPLYIIFSSVLLIGIGASLWSFIIKAVNWILEMIPGA